MRGKELLDQMALVDPAYVEEADVYPKIKKRISWKAVAAVICLVLSIGSLRYFNLSSTPDPRPSAYTVGSTMESWAGTLVYHTDDSENHIIGFTLTIQYPPTWFNVYFDGYMILEEWTEIIDGREVLHHRTERICAVTPGSHFTNVNTTYRDDLLMITVNGAPADRLPEAAGTYEIIIDYSKAAEAFDGMYGTMSIDGFGNLWYSQKKKN